MASPGGSSGSSPDPSKLEQLQIDNDNLRQDLKLREEEVEKLNNLVNQLRTTVDQLENEKKLLQTKVESLLNSSNNQDEVVETNRNSVLSDCKEAAFQVAKEQFLAGMAYEHTSGLYYDYKTGYYYDNDRGLFYDGTNGVYYSYNYDTQAYEVHSRVDGAAGDAPTRKEAKKSDRKRRKRRRRVPSGGSTHSDVTEELAARETHPRGEGGYPLSEPPTPVSKLETLSEEGEDGECSSSTSDSSSVVTISDDDEPEEVRQDEDAPPPCIRLMVIPSTAEGTEGEAKEKSSEQVGSLFIVTCKGGTIGREGPDHQVLLANEVGCSKEHAAIVYKGRKYFLMDANSRNGTFVNGRAAPSTGDPVEIGHGTLIQIGTTCLNCHVHPGRETCLECEPGNVMPVAASANNAFISAKKREKMRKKELQRLKNKYGANGDISAPQSFNDRAADRRRQAGSDNPYEKTAAASTKIAIDSGNKGFKMLAKMGWSLGQGLGTPANQGRTEPVPMTANAERAGLGTAAAVADPTTVKPQTVPGKRKEKERAEILHKTHQRYKALEK